MPTLAQIYSRKNPGGGFTMPTAETPGTVTQPDFRTTQGQSGPVAGTPFYQPGADPTRQMQGQDWNQETFSQQFGSPSTVNDLLAIEGKLGQSGIKVLRNAAGVAGKVQLPNGQIVDVINSAGLGGRGFQWLTGDGGGAQGGMGGGYSTNPSGRLASFSAPGINAPWTEEFKAPDPNAILNDPYYKFQLGQGEEGIQRSAAARGTLLTGGTLKDLTSFGQGLASSFGDKAYNRAFGQYQNDQNTFWNNQNNAYNHLSGFTQLGMQGAQQAGNYGTQYGNAVNPNVINQGQANAGATFGQGVNTGNAAARVAENVLDTDWSKIFKSRTGRNPGSAMVGT